MPSESERDRRWNTIRKVMKKNNIDCLIAGAPLGYMPNPGNQIYYISNFVPFFNHGIFVVFPLQGDPLIRVSYNSGPQFIHCASATSWIKEIIESIQPAQDIVEKIKRLGLEKGRIGIIGYKSQMFPAVINDTLREMLPDAIFEDATPAFNEAMNEVSRNSEEELTFLKKTCEIHDLTFKAVAEALKPGVKELDLWVAAESAIIKNGGWYSSFILATSGPYPTFPRAPASHNTLSKGDVVLFEINVIYAGISSQISLALSIGRPNNEVEAMFKLCKEFYNFSLSELEKNRTFLDIELDLAGRIHGAGFEPMTPQIHIYNQSVAMPMNSQPQPGDYFTVHPNMCNQDYTAGAKVGDTVRIRKDGKVERLQKTPAELNII